MLCIGRTSSGEVNIGAFNDGYVGRITKVVNSPLNKVSGDFLLGKQAVNGA